MAESKELSCDFTLKGLQFRYQTNFKAFFCDQKDMLMILQHNFPENLKEVLDKYPELKAVSEENTREQDMKPSRITDALTSWVKVDPKDTKDAVPQVIDGRGAEETKQAGKKKPGMISRLSKSIKRIIAKITPTKLRKRWHLDEEEELNGETGEKR